MSGNGPSPLAWLLWKSSIAIVWLYQGLWHKVLSSDDRHRRIMAQALGEGTGPPLCMALGLFEAALGIAVLLGFLPRWVAVLQILLLVGMNAAGLIFAAGSIPDPVGMIVMNLAFALSLWMHASLSIQRRP